MSGATGGAGTAYLSVAHEFTLGCFVGFELLTLKFYVNNFIDHCLSFFLWPLQWPLQLVYCSYFLYEGQHGGRSICECLNF